MAVSVDHTRLGKNWYYVIDLGYVDGKRKRIKKRGFANEEEASAAMEAKIAELGLTIKPEKPKQRKIKDYRELLRLGLFGGQQNSRKNNVKNRRSRRKYFEMEIENMLIEDINSLENGMKVIANQLQINNAIVDVLTKDLNGNVCIIEIKNNGDDESIIFQALYYPSLINAPTRMILLCPEYCPRIAAVLSKFQNIETYTYKVENGRLNIKRVFLGVDAGVIWEPHSK
jgi:hypothetical protein